MAAGVGRAPTPDRGARVLRAADRTPHRRPPRPRASESHAVAGSAARPSVEVNAFHVLGGVLAAWALLVSFLGITREHFPASKPAERLVAAISILLVAGALGSAVITAANEEEEEGEGEGKEHAALAREL